MFRAATYILYPPNGRLALIICFVLWGKLPFKMERLSLLLDGHPKALRQIERAMILAPCWAVQKRK